MITPPHGMSKQSLGLKWLAQWAMPPVGEVTLLHPRLVSLPLSLSPPHPPSLLSDLFGVKLSEALFSSFPWFLYLLLGE